jgi:hypothetical protein
MNLQKMRIIVNRVSFWNYAFKVAQDGDRCYLQASYLDADVISGQPAQQTTRKWLLSEHMTPSELVQTCFKLVITSMEHRTREGFAYKNCRVFGPHFDVEALVGLCQEKKLDYRKEA